MPVAGSFLEVMSEQLGEDDGGIETPVTSWSTRLNFYPQNSYFFDVVLDRNGKKEKLKYSEKVRFRFDRESGKYVQK